MESEIPVRVAVVCKRHTLSQEDNYCCFSRGSMGLRFKSCQRGLTVIFRCLIFVQVDYRVDSPRAGPGNTGQADPGSPREDGNDFLPEGSAESSEDNLDADFQGPRKRQRTVPGAKPVQKTTTTTPAGKEQISKVAFQGMEYYLQKSPNTQQWQAVRGGSLIQPAAAFQQRTLLTVPTYRPHDPQPLVTSHGMSHVQLRPSAAATMPPLPYHQQSAAFQRLAAVIPGTGSLAFQPQERLKTLASQPSGLSQLVGVSNAKGTQQQQQNALGASIPPQERPAQMEQVLRDFSLLDRASFLKVSKMLLKCQRTSSYSIHIHI